MPVFHGDHVELNIDVILRVQELGEFADGEAVAYRQRVIGDEGSFVRVEHGAFDDVSVQRVRAVENVEGDVAFRGFFHAVGHSGSVRIEADAGVLDVEDQRVDAV